MDEIYLWIKNIVIYMILNTIIMNLLGNSSYKKYVSIVSGMLLVLIVISPLIRLLKIDDKLDYFFQSNNFAIEASDFKNSLFLMEQKQSEAVFADYKDKIKRQVEKILLNENVYVNDFQVSFDMDVNSRSFGEILKMNIKASEKKEEIKEKSINSVNEIVISPIVINGQKEKSIVENLPSPSEINIKNRLSDFYNIEPDNINISIQGG